MKFFRGKRISQSEYDVEGIGAFKFHKWPNENFWMNQFEITKSRIPIDLSIAVEEYRLPTKIELEKLRELLFSMAELENVIFKAVENSFSKKDNFMNVEFLKTMYFISSISLKNDKGEFWVVLEPFPEVEHGYDQLLRFTIKDMVITWSNIN